MKIPIPFLKDSTRAFIQEARKTPNFSLGKFIHGYIYGRWIYLYIGIGTGEHWLAKTWVKLSRFFTRSVKAPKKAEKDPSRLTFADTYHGKAVPLDTARQLVMIQEDIRVPDLEQVIPYKRARALILNHPDHIAVLDCPCRSARENPCQPMDVCLVVGEPFASFIVDHNPKHARRISQDEAIEILTAEDARGHAHHVFFKEAMLQRYYAICNCCSCCCAAIRAHQHGTPMLASSGYVAQVDETLCIGCEDCQAYCQFNAIEIVAGASQVAAERCMGCGVCISKCPQGAISLMADERRGIPLKIEELMDKAAAS